MGKGGAAEEMPHPVGGRSLPLFRVTGRVRPDLVNDDDSAATGVSVALWPALFTVFRHLRRRRPEHATPRRTVHP
jgi:hypothetical protein